MPNQPHPSLPTHVQTTWPPTGGSLGDKKPVLAQESGPGAHYSDAAQRAGRWRGAETARLGALVDPMMLQRMLLGQDPITAEQTGNRSRFVGKINQQAVDPSRRGPGGTADR